MASEYYDRVESIEQVKRSITFDTIQETEKLIDCLGESLHNLEQELEPVLRMAREKNEVGSDPKDIDETPLISSLKMNNSRLSVFLYKLNTIIDRIEL